MGMPRATRIKERNTLRAVRARAPAWGDLEQRLDTRIAGLHPTYAALQSECLDWDAITHVATASGRACRAALRIPPSFRLEARSVVRGAVRPRRRRR
jgi:hypothetical protein